MTTKTIIFDLDGTAIDSPHNQLPSERTAQAISNAQETHNLCAATGRVWSFAKPVLQALNMADPCIVSAGTQICDPQTGSVLWQHNIEAVPMIEIVEVIKQMPSYKVLYNDYDKETYFNGESMSVEFALNQPVYFLGLIFVPEDEADDVVAAFSHIKGIACTRALAQRQGCNDILITNKTATKEHAIAQLLEILGVNKADTTGIGDGHNDLHLFHAVQHKVAMGNAVQELKDAADLVIDHVKNDGMAQYLEGLDCKQ